MRNIFRYTISMQQYHGSCSLGIYVENRDEVCIKLGFIFFNLVINIFDKRKEDWRYFIDDLEGIDDFLGD